MLKALSIFKRFGLMNMRNYENKAQSRKSFLAKTSLLVLWSRSLQVSYLKENY